MIPSVLIDYPTNGLLAPFPWISQIDWENVLLPMSTSRGKNKKRKKGKERKTMGAIVNARKYGYRSADRA